MFKVLLFLLFASMGYPAPTFPTPSWVGHFCYVFGYFCTFFAVRELKLKIPQLTDIQQLSIDSMRTFVQQEVKPNEALLRFGPASREQLLEFTQAVAEFGLPGLAVPKALGGSGMDWVTQARLFEELVKGSLELASVVLVNMLAVELLIERPALCNQYLPDLLAGRSIASLGLMVQSDCSALRAQRLAHGLLIDGNIDEVAGGLWANLLISSVLVDDQHACLVLLDRRRDRYETRGIRLESNAARVLVTAARVEKEYCLGEVEPGSTLSRRMLDFVRLHEAIAQVAQGQVIVEGALAKSAQGFCSTSERLVSLHLAEMITQVESARLMCQHGLSLAQDHRDCEMESNMALFFTQGAVERIERHAAWVNGPGGDRNAVGTLQLGPLCASKALTACDIVRQRPA